MNYTFNEFYPAKPVLNLDGEKYPLSLITLRHLVIFETNYGGLQEGLDKINERPEILLEMIWDLIDQSSFNKKYSRFKKVFFKGSTVETAKESYRVLNLCIGGSMPLIKNKKRYDDIQRIKKSQSDDQNQVSCYGKIYDVIASRYSYTVNEFYELTLRQIHALLEKADDGKHSDIEIQAALLGKKLQPKVTYVDVPEEVERAQENDAMEAVAKLRKQYEERIKQKESK